MTKTYKITGMKCQGCVNTVTEKLSAVKGVDKVQVDLEQTSHYRRETLEMVSQTCPKRH